MELRRYLTILRSRLWLLLITMLLGAGVGYTFADDGGLYSAQSTIYVGSRNVSLEPGSGDLTNDRIAALQSVVLTYSKMIDSLTMAQEAARDLDLDMSPTDIVDAVKATPEYGTQLLYIDVTDSDPATAQAVANAIADAFIEAVQVFEPAADEGAVPRLPAYIFERAQLPTAPLPGNILQSTLLGALLGLVLAVGLAFLLDYLDLSIRSAVDAERRLEVPVLGVIPSFGDALPIADRSRRGGG